MLAMTPRTPWPPPLDVASFDTDRNSTGGYDVESLLEVLYA
jgi:hypothetical protein